jgi:hypothetical protein
VADGFISPRKEGVLRIFTPLKIHTPWLGLNPETSGPMADTLTTRPSRTTSFNDIDIYSSFKELKKITYNREFTFKYRLILQLLFITDISSTQYAL